VGAAGWWQYEEAAMPIEFDNQNVDVSGVDDRRGGGGGGGGMGGGAAIGGGAGILGVIIFILFKLLGVDPSGAANGTVTLPDTTQNQVGAGSESNQQLSDRCNAVGALQKYTDCRLIKEFNIDNTVWEEEFTRLGRSGDYYPPKLAFFTSRTTTGCGPATADVGPFYCPADHEIYIELGFLEQLQQQFGAQGEYAQAYIVAHEYGHHLQSLLGIEPKVRQAQDQNPQLANQYSVAMELQADCFAGVWANLSDASKTNGVKLTQENIDNALQAAGAVGDDRIQAKTQGRVTPETFTHGTSAQRQQWFATGLKSGDINQCNTFRSAN
jgi:uncharacterized protein